MKPCSTDLNFSFGALVWSQRTRKYYVVHEDCGEAGLYVRRWIGGPGNGYEYGPHVYIKTDYCVLYDPIAKCHVHGSLHP